MRAALRQAADHLERSGYRVSEVEVPDINGVWQTWCDIITNETAVLQEAEMLKVTSADFHNAWGGVKAGQPARPAGLDAGDSRAQRPYPGLAVVLRGISVSCSRRPR